MALGEVYRMELMDLQNFQGMTRLLAKLAHGTNTKVEMCHISHRRFYRSHCPPITRTITTFDFFTRLTSRQAVKQ